MKIVNTKIFKLDPDFRRQFLNELLCIKKCVDNNIPAIIDLFQEDEFFYIVQGDSAGKTLAEYIKNDIKQEEFNEKIIKVWMEKLIRIVQQFH